MYYGGNKQVRSPELSSNSASSIGEISVNSVKQQAVKNNSHYGALKHLAINNNNSTGNK